MQCPRRAEGVAAFMKDQQDSWHSDCTCSYCGSLSEEEFFRCVETGCQLGPTDKTYKVYVYRPNPDVGKPHIYQSANFEQKGEGWVQITDDNRASLPLDEWQNKHWENGHWVKVEPAQGKLHSKFYFQHLSAEGRTKFIELVNAKKVNIGEPGHFYVLPYFVQVQEN
jgi:hypothetical protein